MADLKSFQTGGTRMTKEEAERDYAPQLKTLRSVRSLTRTPGEVCSYSDCINHEIVVMKVDVAGGCTIYERHRC